MSKKIILKLYICGMTPAARDAIENLKDICKDISNEHTYDVEIIDILERPQLAEDEKILATPTLIKNLPEPLARIVGDLSDREQVLVGLDIVKLMKSETS